MKLNQLSQVLRVAISATWCTVSFLILCTTVYAGNWWLLLAVLALISTTVSAIIFKEEIKYL